MNATTCLADREETFACIPTIQVHKLGSLQNQWCMHFEVKNAQIKSFVVKTYHTQWQSSTTAK